MHVRAFQRHGLRPNEIGEDERRRATDTLLTVNEDTVACSDSFSDKGARALEELRNVGAVRVGDRAAQIHKRLIGLEKVVQASVRRRARRIHNVFDAELAQLWFVLGKLAVADKKAVDNLRVRRLVVLRSEMWD